MSRLSRFFVPFLSAASIFALALHATAQALSDTPHPAAGDTESWSFYCGGFEKEIQRQATEGNDRRQFAEAMRRRQNLFAQANTYFASKAWAGGSADFDWQARGERAAGKDVWDSAPVAERDKVKGDNAAHVAVRAARDKDLAACDAVADQAKGYGASAAAILAPGRK